MSASGAATREAELGRIVPIKLPSKEKSNGKSIGFAVAIIVGLGGLAVAGVGLSRYVQAGSLSNLDQINAIIMMAAGGGGGVLFLAVGIVGSVKNRNVDHTSPHTVQPVVETESARRARLVTAITDALHHTPQDCEEIKQLMQAVKQAGIDIYATYPKPSRPGEEDAPLIQLLIPLIHVDILRSLVNEGIVDLTGYHAALGSPLHIACRLEVSLEMFRYILEQSPKDMLNRVPHADRTAVRSNYIGYTPLCLTISTNQTEKAQALLLTEADPNIAHEGNKGEKYYPIQYAIRKKNAVIVQCLIDKGAHLEGEDFGGYGLLWLAAETGSREIFEKLKAAGLPEDPDATKLLEDKEREARKIERWKRDRMEDHEAVVPFTTAREQMDKILHESDRVIEEATEMERRLQAQSDAIARQLANGRSVLS